MFGPPNINSLEDEGVVPKSMRLLFTELKKLEQECEVGVVVAIVG